MLQTILIAAAVFGVVILLMAIGVIVRNRQLRGSCGGLAGLRDERGNVLCEACSNPSPTCRGENAETQHKEQAHV